MSFVFWFSIIGFGLLLLWLLAALVSGIYVIFSYIVATLAGVGRSVFSASWAAIGREVSITVLVTLLLPSRMFASRARVLRKAGVHRPVVLIHGFAMNHTNWFWLSRSLRRRGIGPLYRTSYFSFQPILQSAKQLQAFVSTVCRVENVGQVDIVAHSLGGIVTQCYIQQLDGAAHVRRAIAVGTPFHGTLWARVGLLPMAKDMVAGSPFLRRLQEQMVPGSWHSIWSTADAVIIPPESACLAEPHVSAVFSQLGHLSLLFSPAVAAQIVQWLEA